MSIDISADSMVVASTDQVSCELAGEMVILSLRTGEYYGLNPVAASIWSMIQEPRRVGELPRALIAEYEGVSVEQCAEEVRALLGEMLERELIEVR